MKCLDLGVTTGFSDVPLTARNAILHSAWVMLKAAVATAAKG